MKKYLEAGLAVNGHLWYVREGKALKAYAQKQGIDPCYFIDLIALFSPRVQLRQNLRMTLQYLRGEWAHNLLPSVKVAVSHYEKTGIIHGQKCRSFSRALQGDSSAVVLDVHMAELLNVDQKIFDTKAGYTQNALRIIRYARRQNLAPAECQAALWCGKLLLENRRLETVSYAKTLEILS